MVPKPKRETKPISDPAAFAHAAELHLQKQNMMNYVGSRSLKS